MSLNLQNIEYVYQKKLSNFIIFSELIQYIDCAERNVNIITIMFIFVESQYCLLISNNALADT